MPSIMNRAKWEYEGFSSTWLDENKGAFIATIPFLHRNSSWEEHFLRRALQGGSHPILTLHYLRVVFGVDFLTKIKIEIASRFFKDGLEVPPSAAEEKLDEMGKNEAQMAQRNDFLLFTRKHRLHWWHERPRGCSKSAK